MTVISYEENIVHHSLLGFSSVKKFNLSSSILMTFIFCGLLFFSPGYRINFYVPSVVTCFKYLDLAIAFIHLKAYYRVAPRNLFYPMGAEHVTSILLNETVLIKSLTRQCLNNFKLNYRGSLYFFSKFYFNAQSMYLLLTKELCRSC